MAFFSKTIDKLKSALRKTSEVLNTDVRTLFIPGRQIDDAFLNETEEKLIRADLGVGNVTKIIAEIRERWRLGKIRNQEEAGQIFRDELAKGWGPPASEAWWTSRGSKRKLVGRRAVVGAVEYVRDQLQPLNVWISPQLEDLLQLEVE